MPQQDDHRRWQVGGVRQPQLVQRGRQDQPRRQPDLLRPGDRGVSGAGVRVRLGPTGDGQADEAARPGRQAGRQDARRLPAGRVFVGVRRLTTPLPRDPEVIMSEVAAAPSDELIIVNGIDGVTGQYLLEPMTLAEATAQARGRRPPDEHKEPLAATAERLAAGAFEALPFGKDPNNLKDVGWGV